MRTNRAWNKRNRSEINSPEIKLEVAYIKLYKFKQIKSKPEKKRKSRMLSKTECMTHNFWLILQIILIRVEVSMYIQNNTKKCEENLI